VACAVETVDQSRLVTGVRDRIPGLQHLWQIDAGAVGQLLAQEIEALYAPRRRA
jgi:long-chain acyl-CoA synthetase